jgi:hypothetical protein
MKGGLIIEVASLRDNLVVFYYFSEPEIWLHKRDGLWWVFTTKTYISNSVSTTRLGNNVHHVSSSGSLIGWRMLTHTLSNIPVKLNRLV